MPHAEKLSIALTPEMAEMVRRAVDSGDYASASEVIREALRDWKTKRIVWSWGQDEISGPHDATLLANGNVLLFDNGLGRDWSRVIEVDPFTREIVWEYRAEGMFTLSLQAEIEVI